MRFRPFRMRSSPSLGNEQSSSRKRGLEANSSCVALRHPLHGEFLALLGAVEEIKIEQVMVRKGGQRGRARSRQDRDKCIVPPTKEKDGEANSPLQRLRMAA